MSNDQLAEGTRAITVSLEVGVTENGDVILPREGIGKLLYELLTARHGTTISEFADTVGATSARRLNGSNGSSGSNGANGVHKMAAPRAPAPGRQSYFAKKKALGQCAYCTRKPKAGFALCPKHYAATVARAKKARAAKANGKSKGATA